MEEQPPADPNTAFHLSEADFFQILSNFDEGVIITDAAGRIVFYNRVQAKIDRLEADKVVGKNLGEVYDLDEGTSMIMRCLKSGRAVLHQMLFYRPRSGRPVHAIHSVFPIQGANGFRGAICFVKDSEAIEKEIVSSSSLQTGPNRKLKNGTRFTFADLIGADGHFLNCLKKARSAAGSPSPIMLLGETGTGKEMFAQAIHNYSKRRRNRYIAMNCAAIPEHLLESLLFGTVKGAFTGALDKPGLFEQARDGTLYLDEIESMPLNLQAKLLRVLQENKIRRLGSEEECDVNVKITSSLNCDPLDAIQDGLLRRDLFHRLGVVFIEIPPLRRRRSDLDALVRHFLYKHNLRLDTRVQQASPDVMQRFRRYHWPGNIRELEHMIEAALNVVEAQEDTLTADQLPVHFREDRNGEGRILQKYGDPGLETPAAAEDTHKRIGGSQRLPSADMETEFQNGNGLARIQKQQENDLIRRVLADTDGRIAEAARKLHVSRQLLHYKLKKHGIDPKDYRTKS